jgi:hypothetical protein
MIVLTETRDLFPGFLELDLAAQPGSLGLTPFSSTGEFNSLLVPGTLATLIKPAGASFNPVQFLAEQLEFLDPTLAFTRPHSKLKNAYAYQYGIDFEKHIGNRRLCLNCLSQPRGQAQRISLKFKLLKIGEFA